MTDRVIALGFFDGVHLGHGALLRETAGIAAREKLEPAALTFLGHVAGKPARQLTTPEERERSIRELYGLKTVFLTFDEQLRGTMPADFVCLLRDRFCAAHLVAGYDFTFGRGGSGNAATLQDCCKRLGLGCTLIDVVLLDGLPVSTSRIREMLSLGRMKKAVELMGHPYALTLEFSRTEGTCLCHRIPEETLLPAAGRYLGRTERGTVCADVRGSELFLSGPGAADGPVRLLLESEV